MSDSARIRDLVNDALGDAAVGGILAEGVVKRIALALETRLAQAVSLSGPSLLEAVTAMPEVPQGPTCERAKAIIEEIWNGSGPAGADCGFARGVALITEACRRAGTNTWVNTDHYGVKYCGFSRTAAVLSEDEIRQLANWSWSEQNDAWYFFK